MCVRKSGESSRVRADFKYRRGDKRGRASDGEGDDIFCGFPCFLARARTHQTRSGEREYFAHPSASSVVFFLSTARLLKTHAAIVC